MVTPPLAPIPSLFDAVKRATSSTSSTFLCTKPTLVHLSHILEDIVLTNHLHALMFTGFQESSHWATETQRYRQLAQIAKQVCIFAGKPLPIDAETDLVQVELAPQDPLKQEWFLLILSPTFSVVLCGLEKAKQGNHGEFETIFAFDVPTLTAVSDELALILTRYRPDLLPELAQLRQNFATYQLYLPFVHHIISDLLTFETTLNRQLAKSNAEQIAINQILKEQRDLNNAMIDHSTMFMVLANPNGTIIRANRAFSEAICIPEESLIGHPLPAACIHPEDVAIICAIREKLFSGEEYHRLEFRYLSMDGREIPVEWHASLIYDEHHQPKYVLGVGNDITSRRRAEQLLLEQERLRVELKKERELNDLRLQFMMTVSHEFRTPLATILTSSELLHSHRARMTEEDIERRLSKIKEQVLHLADLVSTMTHIIENEGKPIAPSLALLNVAPFVEGLLIDLNMTMGNKHMVHFHTNCQQELVPVDVTILRHILVNLIQNALKYSPPNTPVHVFYECEQEWLTFRVTDEGIGIPQKDSDRIFEAFYRGGNIGALGGTGLGLKIVADNVDAYGGKISFEPNGEKGTIFIVQLPMKLPPTA